MAVDPLGLALQQLFSAQKKMQQPITRAETNEMAWRRRLGDQGQITAQRPTLTQRMENGISAGLSGLGVENRRANRWADRAVGGLNDFTPVGNATGAIEGGGQFKRGVTRGNLKQAALGAGVFGLSMLPFAGPAKRRGGKILGDLMRDESGAIRAWHGSPHDFDKFSIDRIGSGQGSQAYGHGLYFSTERKAAGGYSKGGRLYEVDIRADPGDFIDWDAPMSDQPAKAVALAKAAEAERIAREGGGAYRLDQAGGMTSHGGRAERGTGGGIYQYLSAPRYGATEATAAQELRNAGIPGLRFKDNYVVFDDSLIGIRNKY